MARASARVFFAVDDFVDDDRLYDAPTGALPKEFDSARK